MSFIKYRLREVASDFGTTPKEISEILTKYCVKPKSNTQVLTEEELNVVFAVMTKNHQIASLEQVFAVKPKEEPKKEQPAAEKEEPKTQQIAQQPRKEQPAPRQQGGVQQPGRPQPARPQQPREPAPRLLRSCHEKTRNCMTEYMARTVDGETGAVFRRLADRAEQQCMRIAELAGML